MKIKVSVPATSANVGSGFDALGLAVTLYNTVTFEESDKLDISAADGTRIPRNESNLVYRSAKGLFDKVGKKIPPLKIVQTNPIPMARGLGSSSACIIAGLLGANRMLGDVLNTQELLTLATAIEGHPDNVAPALLGGLTSSVFEDGVVYSVKRDVDQSLCFAAIVPDYKLLTEAARAALHYWEEPCISGKRGSGAGFFFHSGQAVEKPVVQLQLVGAGASRRGVAARRGAGLFSGPPNGQACSCEAQAQSRDYPVPPAPQSREGCLRRARRKRLRPQENRFFRPIHVDDPAEPL